MSHPVGIGQLEFEITVNVSPERAWSAFVDDTTQWWLPDFYAGGEIARGFHIEARVGGRVWEDWGDGGGLLWYTVIGLLPGKSLELAGHLTPAFGGPAKTYLKLTFSPDGAEGTRLKIEDSIVGRLGPNALEQFESGWRLLFGDGFKAYVEGKKSP